MFFIILNPSNMWQHLKFFPQRQFRCSKRCTQKLWLQHFDVFSLHNFFPNKIFLRWWWLQKSLILGTRLKHLLFVLLYLFVFFVFESSTKQDFITFEFFWHFAAESLFSCKVFCNLHFDCLYYLALCDSVNMTS